MTTWRMLVPADAPRAAAVDHAAAGPAAWGAAAVAAFLKSQHHYGLLAERGPAAAGFLLASLAGPGAIRVCRLCVAPEHQGLGVATLLVRQVAAKLHPRRPRLVVDVEEGQLDLIYFFKDFGVRHQGGLAVAATLLPGLFAAEGGADGVRFTFTLKGLLNGE